METIAHEFGHWVGLPHTFDIQQPPSFIQVHISQGQTGDNFMDYKKKTVVQNAPGKFYTMTKYIIITIFITFNCSILNAQRKETIDGDSLFSILEENQTIDDFLIQYPRLLNRINFTSVYEHKMVKEKLIKWLDRDLFYQEQLRKYKASFELDSLYIKTKIKKKTKLDNLDFDQILKDPVRYNEYKDEILDEKVIEFEKNKKMLGKPYPPEEIIYLHSKLAYLEAYTIIRNWWLEDGGDGKSRFFKYLLLMQDPMAITIYNEKVDRILSTNGKSDDLIKFFNELVFDLRNSYAILKMTELQELNRPVEFMSEGITSKPFSCELKKFLIDEFKSFSIKIDDSIKNNLSCDQLNKYNSLIEPKAILLAKELSTKEFYWKRNLPYYEE